MGWRGTMRSMNAAAKRSARAADQRHKVAAKQQQTADAKQDVDDWQTYIAELMSIHTDLTDRIDWERIKSVPAPYEPGPISGSESRARRALKSYQPTFFAKVFGSSTKKISALEAGIERAIAKDKSETARAKLGFEKSLKEWKSERELAVRVCAGEKESFAEVVREYQTLSADAQLGKRLGFSVTESWTHIVIDVHDESIVPNFRRKQLASGKLSQTKMPAGEFNNIYQDYVASVAIRVAGDFFQMLPADEVYVTCQTEMLDTSTGYKPLTPIVSVKFVRPTFNQLNLRGIDPSDALQNFTHNMKFKQSKGFSRIEALVVDEPFPETQAGT